MGVPGRIGDLQPFAELGRGAATIVYKAYQKSLNRVVLLKLLRPDYTHSDKIVQRFEEEARLIAQIQHPNVVAIYNYGRVDDRSFFVAEFVEGTDLASLLEDHGKLPLELATYIFREATKGLAAAHQANILHRDIKPGNIMIGADGQVKLTDFGMASIIPENESQCEVRGTPEYMAPEQLSCDTTTSASDLFSLGATFYEMLAGRKAFPGSEINECIDAVLNHDPFPALELIRIVPDDLKHILQRLLAKDAADRYTDCESAIDAINAFREKYHLSAESAELAAYLDHPAAYDPEVAAQDLEEIESAEAREDEAVRRPAPVVPPLPADVYQLVPDLNKTVLAVLVLLIIGAAGYLIADRSGAEMLRSERPGGRAVVLPDSIDSYDPLPNYGPFRVFAVPGALEADSADAASRASDAPARAGGASTSAESAAPSRGYLTVHSTPEAAVFLNGDSLGFTPLADSVEVDTGRHSLVVRHPDYPEYQDSVAVQAAEETTVEIALDSLVGQVDIRISPWAEVYIDGAFRDTIPPRGSPFLLTPGRHLVSLQHPELGVRDTTLWIVAGERHELKFILHEVEQ